MNTGKAIEIIERGGWGYPEPMITEANLMAIEALKEREEYQAAHEKTKAVKVKADKVWNTFKCPICGQIHGDDEHDVETLNYCPHCGQKLEWEGR